ncbi:hypothetical protein [Streptomyces lavendofoliae]|nr:hypothetical protein [Streptomyces lavendofoliae]
MGDTVVIARRLSDPKPPHPAGRHLLVDGRAGGFGDEPERGTAITTAFGT